jgi:amidophosphoribosyltransferase
VRISCPPHRFPCHYGIDFQVKDELIAANYTLKEIEKFLNVESLGYLSDEGLLGCTSSPRNYCTACFTGDYPVPSDATGKKISKRNIRKSVTV